VVRLTSPSTGDIAQSTRLDITMLDHIILTVSDLLRSIAFYLKALVPLGITQILDYKGQNGHPDPWTDASTGTRRAGVLALMIAAPAFSMIFPLRWDGLRRSGPYFPLHLLCGHSLACRASTGYHVDNRRGTIIGTKPGIPHNASY
jgi:hypothetical protein